MREYQGVSLEFLRYSKEIDDYRIFDDLYAMFCNISCVFCKTFQAFNLEAIMFEGLMKILSSNPVTFSTKFHFHILLSWFLNFSWRLSDIRDLYSPRPLSNSRRPPPKARINDPPNQPQAPPQSNILLRTWKMGEKRGKNQFFIDAIFVCKF